MAKNDDFLGMDEETRRREKQKNESQKKLMGLPNFLLLLLEPIIADFARSALHMCHYDYNRVLFRSLYKFTSNFMELKSHFFLLLANPSWTISSI